MMGPPGIWNPCPGFGLVRRTDGWAAHGAVQLNAYHRAGFVPELLRASPRLCYLSSYLSVWGEYYGTGGCASVLGLHSALAFATLVLPRSLTQNP